MLVVVASSRDRHARRLRSRWAPHDVGVLTPRDLATTGWSYCSTDPTGSAAVVGGNVVPLSTIDGVLVRLPRVIPHELPEIASTEREYVAAEMTAFLIAVLESLTCPVLNPPVAPLLTSPAWRPEQWALVSVRAGIPTAPPEGLLIRPPPPHRRAPSAGARRGRPIQSAVTVVGSRCLGQADDDLREKARLLAKVSDARLLVARFRCTRAGSVFVSADPWADIDDESVAAALLAYLLGQRR
jgi:hypothetical protein